MSASETFSAPSHLQLPLESGGVWDVTNAEGAGFGTMTPPCRDRALREHRVRAADRSARTQDGRRGGHAHGSSGAAGMSATRAEPLKPYLSAVLGTNEVNTLEMASAYGTLATGGLRVRPVPVSRITDARGTIVWEADVAPERVLDPQVTSVANSILNEAVLFGTGTAANIGRPQIGKTGHGDGSLRRVVRGCDPADGGGRVGRLPPRSGADGAAEDTDHRLRRNLAGTDLAAADARGRHAVCPSMEFPNPDRRVRLRDGRRHAGAVLPPQPVHASAEHPDPAVHRGHRADEGLHLAPRPCSGCSSRPRSGGRNRSRSKG